MAWVCLARTSRGMPRWAAQCSKRATWLRQGCGVRRGSKNHLYCIDGGCGHGNWLESGSCLPGSCSAAELGIFGYFVLVAPTRIRYRSSGALDGTPSHIGRLDGLQRTVLDGFADGSLLFVGCFVALPLVRGEPHTTLLEWRFILIGACLGLATLAKGLVPLALCVPFLWFLRRFWRRWWVALFSCAVVAGPWYVAVYAANGNRFIEDFFWKHHVQRLYSASLQHVQPWYYYFPVLLGGLFPWTPLIGLLAFPRASWDDRKRFLASVFCFGFLLFSISLNKLPGYLLPLFPVMFVLLASQFASKDTARNQQLWLLPCALLISLIPMLAQLLPEWLSGGRLSSLPISSFTPVDLFYVIVSAAIVFAAPRSWTVLLLILCISWGGIHLKHIAYPVLDQKVSVRGLWRDIKGLPGAICDAGLDREWQYGLAFYRGSPVPHCGTGKFDFALRPSAHGPPSVGVLKENVGAR